MSIYSPRNSPGQNNGVGSCSLFQGIFPTQGSNPGLPYCRLILYQLSHQGSPTILEWVTYAFSRGSSWPRNWTEVSCIEADSLPAELPGKNFRNKQSRSRYIWMIFPKLRSLWNKDIKPEDYFVDLLFNVRFPYDSRVLQILKLWIGSLTLIFLSRPYYQYLCFPWSCSSIL